MLRMKVSKAIKSSLTFSIGFIGMFVIIGYFIENLGPAVEAFVTRTGLKLNMLDVSWPPLALAAWSNKFAPLLLIVMIIVNILLLIFKITKTVNIDIWNYWHYILTGAIIYKITDNIAYSVVMMLVTYILMLKLADWAAPSIEKYMGLSNITITHFSVITYFPLAVLGYKLLRKIPGLDKVHVDPVMIRRKLGILGETMTIGFIMGILFGVCAGYDFRATLELAFVVSAVIYIIPLMSKEIAKGFIPISECMDSYLKEKFDGKRKIYVSMIIQAFIDDTVLVTSFFLMPIAVLLAFLLPQVEFIPLGSLSTIMLLVIMAVIVSRGNIVYSFLIGIPIAIINLFVSSYLGQIYTNLVMESNFELDGYDGIITSFVDGGNILRLWSVRFSEGGIWGLIVIPIIILFLYIAKKEVVEENE